jgi:PilZ domain
MPGKPPPTTTPSAKDRRTDPRYKFAAASVVTAKDSGKQIKSTVGDLGERGCFITTEDSFALGTIVTVCLTKDSQSFEAEARVVFSSAGKGIGLFFTAIDPAQMEILDEWLSTFLENSWFASTRRQSQRLMMRIPIHVIGKGKSGKMFDEATHTQSVSAHGALILLSVPVKKRQRLILSNEQTKASVECIVAYIGQVQDELVHVGLAFVLPNPGFWGVTFPPDDWSIRHPDAKSPNSQTTVRRK